MLTRICAMGMRAPSIQQRRHVSPQQLCLVRMDNPTNPFSWFLSPRLASLDVGHAHYLLLRIGIRPPLGT
jgi:hypothetical protein